MKRCYSGIRSLYAGCLVLVCPFFMLPASLPAAVISQVYPVPLIINVFGSGNATYLIDGTFYRFKGARPPFDFDFDQNGSTDLTINGNGDPSAPTWAMFVTQHGRNQVWSLAGGAAGFDFGSHALSLAAGSTR
jgi:hypothetical protein